MVTTALPARQNPQQHVLHITDREHRTGSSSSKRCRFRIRIPLFANVAITLIGEYTWPCRGRCLVVVRYSHILKAEHRLFATATARKHKYRTNIGIEQCCQRGTIVLFVVQNIGQWYCIVKVLVVHFDSILAYSWF